MLKLPFAHEVYVLTPSEVSAAEQAPKVNILDALSSANNVKTFVFCGGAITALMVLALFLKTLPIFKSLGKRLDQATAFAPDVIRIVFGVSLLFSARHQAVFGPELPAGQFSFSEIIVPFLYFSGLSLILGIRIRLLGILTALFWLFTFFDRGFYMLNYAHYLGESLALILFWRQKFSLDRLISRAKIKKLAYEEWSMPVARILFGFSILYAAINVKFVTAALSLDVAQQYELTRYFHLDPLFIVLGAALTESLIAILFMLGLLRRLNASIFIIFLVISILFFKESVWPHYLLLGLAAGIFLHKADRLALDNYIPRRKH